MPISSCQLDVFLISYGYLRPDSLQGQLIMSVAYGYDLKGGDKILEAPVQISKLMSRLLSPGGALVNYLPFRAVLNFFLPFQS